VRNLSNFVVCIYVTRVSRYIQRSVLSAVSSNSGRSCNVLPADIGALPYMENKRGCIRRRI